MYQHGVQLPDGTAAFWQIPDDANGFGIVGLRLFNLIPPFDDWMFFFSFSEGLRNDSVQSLHRRQKFHSTSATGWTLLQKLLVMTSRLSAHRLLHLCFLLVSGLRFILLKVPIHILKKEHFQQQHLLHNHTSTQLATQPTSR